MPDRAHQYAYRPPVEAIVPQPEVYREALQPDSFFEASSESEPDAGKPLNGCVRVVDVISSLFLPVFARLATFNRMQTSTIPVVKNPLLSLFF